MLITNGRSDDVIDGPVKAIAESGISLFAVGKQHHHFTPLLPVLVNVGISHEIHRYTVLYISKYGGVDAACVCQRLASLPRLLNARPNLDAQSVEIIAAH